MGSFTTRTARQRNWRLALAAACALASPAPLLWAADKSPPSTPVVTDDGTYTTSTTQLHATWTSSDAQSGIAEYQYLIRQDSTSGTIIVNWTSTGTVASVTRTGLSLANGKTYYFQVKSKNGAGLWSAIGSSNGIKVDASAPSAPGLPKEGSSTTDLDYDGDGAYTIYWSASTDAESGISAYQVQERIGTTGTWTTLTSSVTTTSYAVSSRVHNTRYFYQVRAKNGAGLWGSWSATSDGILVDKTAPSAVTVTDDGVTTFSTTQLHARWTASNDAESGISDYEYLIRQDSTTGTIIVNWTSAGLVTEWTRTGLSLTIGKTYYIGVRAKNGSALYSAAAYSDGITVQADTTPPTGTISINSGAAYTKTPAVTLTLSATDNSGTVSQMQFSNDTVTYSTPESYATTKSWTLTSGDGSKSVYVKFSDPKGNWSTPVSDTITLDATPPTITITSPLDGAVLGAP
jgi:hypothetical protein